MSWLLTIPLRRASRQHTRPGRRAFEITNEGDLILGDNNLSADTSTDFDADTAIPDGAWYATSRKWMGRSALFRELGDAVDLALGRAGGTYPDGPPVGIEAGDPIGAVYSQGWTTPTGGTPGVTEGGTFTPRSYAGGEIAFYARENYIDNGDGTYDCGSEIRLRTSPVGGGTTAERMLIAADGQVAVMGPNLSADAVYANYEEGDLIAAGKVVGRNGLVAPHISGDTPTGGSSGEIRVGTDKLWVNDNGTWKYVALTTPP